MNHLVLARKYRPRTFDDVIGQGLIVSTLKAAVQSQRVAHALLFTGGRGIGKTTIARIVAKALVCLARKDAEPCGECTHCLSIDNFSSLDVIEIDGASHTGVDDIRELRDSARYQPASARYKIFIIDEVHMLSTSAFNALLKILEEPPEHVMFIFATTEAHKIPKTILSRCQRYDFRRMSTTDILATLKKIMVSEEIIVEDEGLQLIAGLADGSMRDALSMLEQIISEPHEQYSADFIATKLGVVSHSVVKQAALALIEGHVDTALILVKEVYEKGFDLCQFMDALTERFRVLSLCAHVNKKNAAAIISSVDDKDFLLVERFDKADLKRLFAMSLDAMPQVFQAAKPLFAVELFLLRAALRPPMSDAVTINYYLQKLDAIMHDRPLPKEPTKPLPIKVVDSALPSSLSPDEVVAKFVNVVSELAATTPALASHLRHARPALDMALRHLTLHFEQSLHYEQVKAHTTNATFLKAIATVFGQQLTVKIELTKTQPASIKAIKTVSETDEHRQQLEERALYERASNNSLVKKALEIFGGDITSVKKFTKTNPIPGHHAE